jgi:hypothetical protein
MMQSRIMSRRMSAEATAWGRRDAARRAVEGEPVTAGEDGPGLDEAEFRRRFAHLLSGNSGTV